LIHNAVVNTAPVPSLKFAPFPRWIKCYVTWTVNVLVVGATMESIVRAKLVWGNHALIIWSVSLVAVTMAYVKANLTLEKPAQEMNNAVVNTAPVPSLKFAPFPRLTTFFVT
jgi:hypothetical protein